MNLEPKKKTVTFIEEEPLENHEGDKITTIVKEKSNNNPTSIIKTEKKNENKIDEEPVEQKELLKHITRKEIRFSHELHKTLVTIPRKVLNRRYKKLQEVKILSVLTPQIIDGDSDYFDEDQIRKREVINDFLS